MLPTMLTALPLDGAPLTMRTYFLGAIGSVAEAFLGRFLGERH